MRRKGLRRIFAAMLVCAVVGTSAETGGLTLYAQETAAESSGEEVVVEERYFSAAEVEEIAEEAFGAGGTLIDGTAVRYIDRVELSEGVKDVYTTLENHTDWLIDPTQSVKIDDTHYCITNGVAFSNWSDAGEMQKELITAYSAFLRDHPEVFWLTGAVKTTAKNVGGNCKAYLILAMTDFDVRDLNHYPDKAAVEAAVSDRDDYVSQIKTAMNTELVGASASTYNKLKFLHDWLTENNKYNSAAVAPGANEDEYRQAHQCISALASSASDPKKYGDPVCEGYAKAFKVLCDQENIPCVLIDGTGITDNGSGAHMWNAVQISDAWYAVDVTWDDPTGGSAIFNSGYEREKYLLVGSDTEIDGRKFSVSHEVENEVMPGGIAFTNGPDLSTTAYDPASSSETITAITVEAGKESWDKIYGDTFTLKGISNNADAPMTYTSANTNVATVDADGKVTVTGVGTTTITVSVATNSGVWTAASKEITVTGTKKEIAVQVDAADMVLGAASLPEFSLKDYQEQLAAGDAMGESTIGVVTYKVYDESDSEVIGVPSEIGTYTIRGTCANTGNYIVICEDGTLTVSAAVGTITRDETQSLTKEYDGTAFTLTAITNSNVPINAAYRQAGGEDSAPFTEEGYPVAVGTYDVRLSTASTTDYTAAELTIKNVEIVKGNGVNPPESTISVSYGKNTKVKDVPLGSDWNWKSTDADKALTEGGKVTATAVYKNDENNYNTVSVDISMSACQHTNTTISNRKAATCTAAGYTGDTICQDCGKTIQTGSTIAALGHSYTGTVTKQPTEDAEGIRTYTCSRCGNTYTEKIAKLPKTSTQTETQSDTQSEASSAGTWKSDGGRWWYENGDGSYPSNGWTQIGDTWYAFDAAGYMQTGWYQSGDAWYYLSADGSMITGWTNQGGTWYYMEDSGAMAVGWRQLDGTWYYFAGSGAMETGWKLIGGTWYYFAGSGAMTTGWSTISGTWYYFGGGGAMTVGWKQLDGSWYYFKGSGAMAAGWQKIGTTWYYFYGSGAMASNTTIGGYRLRADGSMQ